MADDEAPQGSPGAYKVTGVDPEDLRVLLARGVSDAVRDKLTEPPPVPTDLDARAGAIILEMRLCGPGDEGPLVRRLLALGRGAVPVVARHFPGSRWFDRHAAHVHPPRGREVSGPAAALVAFGEDSVEWVAALLEADHPEVRYYAALVAGDLAQPALVPALGRLVFDGDAGVREVAVRALCGLRSSDAFALLRATLVTAACHVATHRSYRCRAIRALAQLLDERSVSVALELLDDGDGEVAEAAREALVILTGRDLGALRIRWTPWWEANQQRVRREWLLDGLQDDEPRTRMRCVEGLRLETGADHGFDPLGPEEQRRAAIEAWRAQLEPPARPPSGS